MMTQQAIDHLMLLSARKIYIKKKRTVLEFQMYVIIFYFERRDSHLSVLLASACLKHDAFVVY